VIGRKVANKFDLSLDEEVLNAAHFTNVQPLSCTDNKKNNKANEDEQN
jgi:hypothetical protein